MSYNLCPDGFMRDSLFTDWSPDSTNNLGEALGQVLFAGNSFPANSILVTPPICLLLSQCTHFAVAGRIGCL